MKNVLEKLLVFIAAVSLLVIGGCTGFIKPQPGSIAPEDSILMLDSLGTAPQVWKTDDLTLSYSTAQSGNRFEISGNILFSRGLTNTFNRAKNFYLIMSFVDDQQRVLQAVDIAPMLKTKEPVSDKVKFKADTEIPQGGVGIVFNYYGVFTGDQPDMGGWEIYSSPYN